MGGLDSLGQLVCPGQSPALLVLRGPRRRQRCGLALGELLVDRQEHKVPKAGLCELQEAGPRGFGGAEELPRGCVSKIFPRLGG